MMRRPFILTIFAFLLLGCEAAVSDAATPPLTEVAAPTTVPSTQTPLPTATEPPTATAVPPTETPLPTATPTALPTVPEAAVTLIPLSGPIISADAEISGMTWYGDWLILLPQYPTFAGSSEDGVLFAIAKADLLAFVDGTSTAPIAPTAVPFTGGNLGRQLSGFEGFEAIAFSGDTGYLTVETSPGRMLGYLVQGEMAPDLSAFVLDTAVTTPIEPQSGSSNKSDESIFIAGEQLVTLYEVNGAALNEAPVAHRFDTALEPVDTIPFPTIEYRVTDATALDEDGRFWAINYFFPGDLDLLPAVDPLAAEYGQGASHAASEQVERLVEFAYTETGVTRTDAPPLQLTLTSEARNWEGIARLDERGFLLATDKFPGTLLAFVPAP